MLAMLVPIILVGLVVMMTLIACGIASTLAQLEVRGYACWHVGNLWVMVLPGYITLSW
jgi:hypothetical protein